MLDKINRGWQLALLSYGILRENKGLVVFPLLSFASMAVLFASFMLPGWPMLSRYFHDQSTHADQLNGTLLLFVFYWINYTIVTFFNVALMAVTLERLEGREADFSTGISRARSQWVSIVAYSAVAATVGTILRTIEERVGWIGNIIFGLIGLAWTVSVALVVPVLAAEDAGPIEAISRSGGLIKKSWGEGLVSGVGVTAFTSLVMVVVMVIGGGAIIGALAHGMTSLAILLGALTAVAFAVMILVSETLSKINLAVLYRFANGEQTAGYDQALLVGAFRAKK